MSLLVVTPNLINIFIGMDYDNDVNQLSILSLDQVYTSHNVKVVLREK